MIEELIPAIGYISSMLISGYTEAQVQQLIKGSTHESTP